MAFHVRDDATDAAVRKLAKLKKKTLTATIREAVEHEYEREYCDDNFMKAVRQAQERFKALGTPTGLLADKAFYDELSGEDELTGLP
jgi:antitoxin VapB